MQRDEPETTKFGLQFTLPKKITEEERRIKQISRKLTQRRPFNPKDPLQRFYRNIEAFSVNQLVIIKLGWKLRDLPPEEHELAMACFTSLSETAKFPFTIFINPIRDPTSGEAFKSLWLQAVILSSPESRDFLEKKKDIEINLFQICEGQLVPLFQSFLEKHVSWGNMVKQEFRGETLVRTFRETVVPRVAEILEHYAKIQAKN